MKDQFDKLINFGMGVFAYSKEKIEDFVDDMVKKGEVRKEDAHDLVQNLIDKGEGQRAKLDDYINEKVAEKLSDFATKEEVRKIIRQELDRADRGEDLSESEE